MSRSENIKLSKVSDKIIINEVEKLNGFISIDEVKDSQQNRNNIYGVDKLHNDINMLLGIDYILVMKIGNSYQTLYIDTKGFNYNPKYNGTIRNGVVTTVLLQIEKYYGGKLLKGWANNPKYWTDFIIILLNNHLYYMNYQRLMEYCNQLEHEQGTSIIQFNKYNGNYEKCIIANVDDMINQRVITSIKPIADTINNHIA